MKRNKKKWKWRHENEKNENEDMEKPWFDDVHERYKWVREGKINVIKDKSH